MRIGITGANGMLGKALLSQLSKSHEVFATSRQKGLIDKNINWDCFDLTNTDLLQAWLEKNKPEILIHCAAIVDVDFCEKNVYLAKELHEEATKVITTFIEHSGGKLIYISTDSVFNGKKLNPYKEDDHVDPLNIYAKTKLEGEQIALRLKNSLVLRTNIIGWTDKNKTSFFEWLLVNLIEEKHINLFHDVYFSPLTVYDLSKVIEHILLNPIYGLYNCASSESISKYDFGLEVCKIFNLSPSNIKSASVDIMNFKATRPKNMALDVSKISSDLVYNLPNVVDTINTMKNQYKD